MALSAFPEKSHRPERAELDATLAGAATLWHELVAYVAAKYPPVSTLWNFSSAKFGWSLRLLRSERVVLYMTPQDGKFLVGVVLGEKAAQAAQQGGLSKAVERIVAAAPRYAEGRGIRLPVATRDALRTAQQLADLKLASGTRSSRAT